MAFKFTLAAVLRLRESIEARELQVLEQTQYEIAHTVHLLETLRDQDVAQHAIRERELGSGTPGAHLCVLEEAKRLLRQQRRSLEELLVKLQVRREQLLASYEAARRGRKVLSELRERQREAYELQAERARQQVADDMFLMRHRKK